MRRITPLLIAGALGLAACGSSGTESGSASPTTNVPSSESAPSTAATTATTSADKPAVSIPDELPTELQVTELRAGSGPEAETGDVVVVHYVGVRSEDGTEFDNSWDRGTPFAVNLGAGGVIPGWDQGLVGTQSGGRYQLDIPADLAYGDQGAGEVIKPGDALTFVVDVLQVAAASSADDQPAIDQDLTSDGATEVTSEDLVSGDGQAAAEGDSVLIDLVAYRGDTGEQVDSTWGAGGPFELELTETGALPGLLEGISGMQVGGRRLIRIPSEQAFGDQGAEDIGIPAGVDLVVIVDLKAVF